MGISSATAALVGKMLGANRQRWENTGEKVVEKKTHRNPSIPLEGLKISSRIFCLGMGTNCTGATWSGVFFQPASFSEKNFSPVFFF